MIEYFLPPYFAVLSAETTSLGLVKNGKNELKYFVSFLNFFSPSFFNITS